MILKTYTSQDSIYFPLFPLTIGSMFHFTQKVES